jgi:hypothetical protein
VILLNTVRKRDYASLAESAVMEGMHLRGGESVEVINRRFVASTHKPFGEALRVLECLQRAMFPYRTGQIILQMRCGRGYTDAAVLVFLAAAERTGDVAANFSVMESDPL